MGHDTEGGRERASGAQLMHISRMPRAHIGGIGLVVVGVCSQPTTAGVEERRVVRARLAMDNGQGLDGGGGGKGATGEFTGPVSLCVTSRQEGVSRTVACGA